ncbi:MAG: hypothetical protein HKO63_02885 [Acidimicrobiia bacterium]|nr:hypothetical protein [Acidimicrobiia bacterium]
MTRDDQILERLRAADPAPGGTRIQPDELSTIFSLLEERRGAVTTQTPIRPQVPLKNERRWLRPVLAFGVALVAVVVAIGIGMFFLGGGEDVVQPSETTLPTPTTVPTTTPTTAPSEVEPPVTTPESAPFETVIAEPLRNMAAMVGSDGNPIFVGEVGTATEPSGSLRLVRCTDPNCLDEPEVVDIVAGIEWQGNLALTGGPNGYPLIGYRSSAGPEGTSFDAYTATDRPGYETFTVMYCTDATCRTFNSYEVGSSEAFHALVAKGWKFTEAGLPLYTYVLGPPNETTMHVVACSDPGCQDVSDTVIDSAPFLRGSRFVHGTPITITSDGGLLTVYSASTPTGPPGVEGGWDEAPMRHEVRAAFCAEPDCSTGAVVTSLGSGTLPLPIAQIDGVTYIKYVQTSEDEELFEGELVLAVIECHNPACTSLTKMDSTPLPGTPFPWEDWKYDADGRLVWVQVDDIMGSGTVDTEDGPQPGEVVIGTRIRYVSCTDVTCTSIAAIELGDLVDADYRAEASVVLAPTGEPVVAVNAPEGIRIMRPLQQ